MLDYGNGEIGAVVDTWLKGPLAISAVEQARFLARLALGELPFARELQARTREIALIEQGDGWSLYAKTGSSLRQPPYVGWWVGWVEKAGRIHGFALNIDIAPKGDAPDRIAIGKACLKTLGIIGS
jgi:beta-lactamase class D